MVGTVATAAGPQQIAAYLRADFSVSLNGSPAILKHVPVIVEGSMYLPLKDVANITGLDVKWNANTSTAELTTKEVEVKATPAPETIPMATPTRPAPATILTVITDGQTTGVYVWDYNLDMLRTSLGVQYKNEVINGKILLVYGDKRFELIPKVDILYDNDYGKGFFSYDFILKTGVFTKEQLDTLKKYTINFKTGYIISPSDLTELSN